mmetsp:Transcript_38494/g.61754  ORF Transcript_38494/g.61754 Transcript_38494/m.61754 type:complete len:305 (+) Transcript_38494:273-1187(+)
MKKVEFYVKDLPRCNPGMPKVDEKEGVFLSPYAKHLPDEVKQARFAVVGSLEDSEGIVLHLPATGDEGYGLRRKRYAMPLYKKHKIASMLLMAPYYKYRRSTRQTSFEIPSIQDLGQQSNAIVTEAVALLKWARSKCPGKPLGVTGVSYGGSMSCLAALLAPMDLAVSLLVPADRPVFLDSVLKSAVSPEVLRDGREKKLKRIFDSMSVAGFYEQLEEHRRISAPSSPASAQRKLVLVEMMGSHDNIVPSWSARAVFKTMSKARGVIASELHEWPGGHASSIAFHACSYVDKVARSIKLLSRAC